MNNEPQFNKWFRAEVGAAFFIGSTVAAIVIWFSGQINPLGTELAVMKTQLDNIKNNDLSHIEVEVSQLNGGQNSLQVEVNDINNKLTRILTLLGK